MPTIKSVPESVQSQTGDIPDLFRPLLVEKVSLREVGPGEPIARVNHGGDQILCLLEGRAEVILGFRAAHEVIIESLEPGDVFGDLAFLTGRRWPVDAGLVAVEPTRVLEISVDGFQRVLRENSDFTVALLKTLGKKIVRVDRSEFTSRAQVQGDGSAAVCAYPSHPGMPADLQMRFQALALSHESVLIVGENGVGKDVLAYAIFDAADRYTEVLVPVNARQIGSESFFLKAASEADLKELNGTEEQMRPLFGYETRGSDGSITLSPGYLDLAREGTLFIRGADFLTGVTQQKLLDAWRTGCYCPPGSSRRMEADFRLICTTEIKPAAFRPERHPLLCELQQNALIIPPLRERRDLVPALATHYLVHYAEEMNKLVPVMDELTLKAMVDYSWPGNDLELANAMRRAVLVSPGDTIRRQDLKFDDPRASGGRYDLMQLRPIRQALLSPLFPAILQSAFVPIFLAIVLLLFFGPPDASRNLASLIMWSLAWPGIIVGAFLGARISCSICAIGALSKLAKRIVSLEWPFPEALRMRSNFLIAGGILFIIWIETATDMRSSPVSLGLLLLTMFLIAFFLNTLFARQAWCRYLCPLGAMTGLFARTSLLELRADSTVCLSRCSTHECYYGTPRTEGCAFGQVVATLHSNQFCKICGNCVKNCPYDAVKLNLRIPGLELGEVRHVRTGTALLVLSLYGALFSDIFTRMPWYDTFMNWMNVSGIAKFTMVYGGSILAANMLALAAAFISHRAFRERFLENYSRFALSLLPLVCAGFLAFHTYYLLTLSPQMLTVLGEYFRIKALGGAAMYVSADSIQIVQQIIIAVGSIWTMITMYRLGHSSPTGRLLKLWGVLPHFFVAAVLTCGLSTVMRWAFPS